VPSQPPPTEGVSLPPSSPLGDPAPSSPFSGLRPGNSGVATLGVVGGGAADRDRRDVAARGLPPALPRRTTRNGLRGGRADRCPVVSPFSGLGWVSRVPSGRFGTPRDGGAAIAEDRPPAPNPHQAFANPGGQGLAIEMSSNGANSALR